MSLYHDINQVNAGSTSLMIIYDFYATISYVHF